MNVCVGKSVRHEALSSFKVAVYVLVVLSLLFAQFSPVPSSAVTSEQTHECRLWGIIGRPSEIVTEIQNHLYGSGWPDYDGLWPRCLKRLGGSSNSFPYNNPNGWGIAYYGRYRTPVIHRGQPPAWNDTNFDDAVKDTANVDTRIAVGHVRRGTDPPTPSDGNPHPFHRLRMGRHWLFGHNGWVNRTKVRSLITEGQNPLTYFRNPNNQWQIPKCHVAHHPDGAGGFRPCDPLVDDDACLFGDIQGNPNTELKGIVDSELYFVYLLKCIENVGGNVSIGVSKAVRELGNAQAIISALNFFLTDGENLWGLCLYKTNPDRYTLYYWIPKCKWCGVIASSVPESNTAEWILMKNATLIKLWMENGDIKSQIYTIEGEVGGITLSIDKFGLLTPYVGLASTVLIVTVATTVYVKRKKKKLNNF
ncbi:MAG: class II glutamine amidotransferase [Candidatus Bathyarchaeia archaeon]